MMQLRKRRYMNQGTNRTP